MSASPSSRLTALPPNIRGALWMVLSCLAATIMATSAKLAVEVVPSTQAAFLRSLIGFALIAPILLYRGGGMIRSRQWKWHVLRAVIAAVSTNMGFYALAHMPLTTASVIFFSTPLFVTALAGRMLGERIGWRRWSATGVGFLGTFIAMQPSAEGIQLPALVALASAILFAFMLLIGKRLSREDPPGTLMIYLVTFSTLGTLPPALPVWVWPAEAVWLLIAVLGLTATLRVYCDIRAFAVAEASAIAPFQYLRLVTIAASGYLVFAEIPDAPTVIGAALIVSAILYIAHREARHRAEAPA